MAETEAELTVNTGEESLSDLFDDSNESKGETETVVEPEVKAETAEKTAEPEAEEATDATTEAKAETEAEPVAETPTAEQGQLAALLAERDKRQKLETELNDLKSKIEPEVIPDPIEDPTGYAEFVRNQSVQSELQTRVNLSRDVMLEVDPDFARLEGVFMGMIMDNEGKVTDQSLLNQFQSAPNPAKFARDKAKEHEQIEAFKDPKYQENLEAEVRAKVLAEIAEAGKTTTATEVPDLTQSAAGSNMTPQTSKTELGEIFEDAEL